MHLNGVGSIVLDIHHYTAQLKKASLQILVQLGADTMVNATRFIGGIVTAPERAVDIYLINIEM